MSRRRLPTPVVAVLAAVGAAAFLILVVLAAADEREHGDLGCRPNCEVRP